MSFKRGCAALAAAAVAAPAAAWGMGIGLGCVNLPAYNRALGTLQGISSCDMTVEQARRIVAERDGPAAVYRQVAPGPRIQASPGIHHRRQRMRTSRP